MIRGLVHNGADDGEQWAPVSDLMAVLMLIFMFIAILFIREIVTEEDQSRDKCKEIYKLLESEFRADFAEWNVQLLEDLTIRFRNPDILFERSKAEIRPQFEGILRRFFPRYMSAITLHRDDIREVRIEGHTSSDWLGVGKNSENLGAISEKKKSDIAYIGNMKLSQERAYAILKFILELPESSKYSEWVKPLITANGLSSSYLLNDDGKLISAEGKDEENPNLSRRVEFRLLAASCQKAGIDHRKKGDSADEN